MKWSEGSIGRALARSTFKDELCVLPNCMWTGYEIDLLVVDQTRRIIDVEIKISRADLKADKEKSKWWHEPPGSWNLQTKRWDRPPKVARPWPPRVWKHYYAMPADIWKDDLLEHIQPVSGVLLVSEPVNKYDIVKVKCLKRAKPCRDAQPIDDRAVIQIARLASLRMWDAYKASEQSEAICE